MLPLHEKIMGSKKVPLSNEGGVFELFHDELVSMVLRDVGAVLHEIYTVYFPHETKAVNG